MMCSCIILYDKNVKKSTKIHIFYKKFIKKKEMKELKNIIVKTLT